MATAVSVEILDYVGDREIFKVGKDLVPGDSVHRLIVSFPTGKKLAVTVNEDVYDEYCKCLGHVPAAQQLTFPLT